ncbi:hypothetical protein ABK040_001847 [Willaertia magna]
MSSVLKVFHSESLMDSSFDERMALKRKKNAGNVVDQTKKEECKSTETQSVCMSTPPTPKEQKQNTEPIDDVVLPSANTILTSKTTSTVKSVESKSPTSPKHVKCSGSTFKARMKERKEKVFSTTVTSPVFDETNQ